MGFLEILYWGASYTTGIACATVFLIHFLQEGDRHSLRLFLFLLPFGLSIVCLSLMSGFPRQPELGRLIGRLALVGAALTAITFPTFAMGDIEDDRKRGISHSFRIAGLAFAALNLAVYLVPERVGAWIQLATLLVLALAIFIGMSWIARGSIAWRSARKPVLMAVLFVFFGAVMVVDFFRGLFRPLSFLGPRYVLLPAFFAYLNVFLLASHAREWAQERKGAEAGGPDASLMDAYGISGREREVLARLASGRTYREIADGLCLSLATIKSHVSHLYEKTGTRNKVELINLLYDSKSQRANQPKSG
jgi:DNA-binding CsgD family transcriptional regulator